MLTQLMIGETANTTLGTSLFVAISMLILIYCIKKFAWNTISEVLKKRADKISNDLDEAEKSRKQAELLENQRIIALQDSKKEALSIINEAKDTAEKNRQSIILESKVDVSNLKEKEKQDIQVERDQTIQAIKGDVAELSIQIAEKLLRNELTDSAQKDLIDSYIEGLEK